MEEACYNKLVDKGFTDFQKYIIRNRLTYLAIIYNMSLELYDIHFFSDIVKLAMDRVNACHCIDFLSSTQYRTLFIIKLEQIVFNWSR